MALVEWADLHPEIFAEREPMVRVAIDHAGENERRLTIEAVGFDATELLAELNDNWAPQA